MIAIMVKSFKDISINIKTFNFFFWQSLLFFFFNLASRVS